LKILCVSCAAALQRGQSHTSLWFASEASQRVHAPFAFPSPSLALAGRRKMSAHRSLGGRNRANIRGQPLRLKETKKMERAKLASGKKTEPTETKHRKLVKKSGRKPIGHSSASAPKRAARNKAESSRPRRKEMGSKSKSEKLVCRYCGSDDLAPSFIKRRDRRCRKCFSKRYRLAAPARKSKIKK
jgi:hypothetical protein